MSYIGNLPFGKTLRTVTSITADGVATTFYPDGGYDVNFVDVFVSGARLSSGLDFTAADGVSVTLLYTPVNGDTIDIVSYGLLELIDPVFPGTISVGSNVVINTSSISVGNSTVNSIITSNSITIGGNLITSGNSSVQGLLKIVDSVSNTSSSIAASANSVTTAYTLAANAVSNATAYAATAYSNAVATAASDATTKAGTAYSNAVSVAASDATTKAGTAYSNVFNGGTFSSTISVGANVSMNTTSIRVGNSTVNTYITSDTVYGPSTLYIDPAAAGDNTGLVVIKGDLQVDGTTFTINSTTVNIDDKNIVLADGAINNAATDGAGLTIYGANANLTYNATGNNFEMSRGLSITGTANVSTAINVGANVNLSTSQINVGNSTVNTVIALGGVGIGNSTVNTVITSTTLTTTSNTVSLGTAAYVVANGNIGFGTSSPAVKLEVAGNTSPVWSTTSGSISGTTLTFTTSSSAAIGDLIYGTGVQPYTRITAGSGLSWTVSVSQTVSSTTIYGTSLYSGTLIRIEETDTAVQATQPVGALQFYGSDSSSPTAGVGAYVAAINESSTPDTALVFGTRDNGGGGIDANERMRLSSLGYLGIGTTSPAVTLDVTGSTNITGTANVATAINVGANVNLSTTQIKVGNSTINTVITSTTLTTTSNTVSLGTAAYVVANGNVGIGTASPGAKLQAVSNVASSYGAVIYNQSATGQGLTVRGGSTSSQDAFNVQTYDGGISLFTVQGGGNVGVGTTSPSVKLHASTSGAGIQEVEWLNNSQAVGADVGSAMVFTGTASNNGLARISGAFAGATTADGAYMAFSTRAVTTGTLTERMRLDSSGNLIVGGTSPTTSSGYTSLSINNATNSGYLVLQSNGTNKSDWYVSGGTVATLRGVAVPLSFEATGANYIKFETNATERARIDSSGNLLLGATSSLNTNGFQLSSGSGASASPYAAIFNTATSPTSAASTRFDLGFLSGVGNYVATGTVLGQIYFMGQANDAGYGGAFITATIISGGNVARASGHSVALTFGTKSSSITGAVEAMRINSSGQLLVGTTTPESAVSNTKRIVGGSFSSFNGVLTSVSSGVAYTLFTMTADFTSYMVTVSALVSTAAYSETAIVHLNNTSVNVIIIAGGSAIAIQNTGMAIQVVQSSGATVSELLWSAMRIT